ncbi:MAG: cysteine hydrolase [Candidatus Rokuibacteriota bacterium]|nr:MAG: cysteine hydrolase [Candidatus Rokubacteria bacterium]
MDDLGPRTAILVIDMVCDMFSREELARQRSAIVAAINTLTDAGRQAGHRVVWIRQEYAADLSDAPLEYRRRRIRSTIAGTAGAALLPELDVAPQDEVVIKKRYSGFFGTDLDDFLRREQVDKLIVAGVNTHACIRTTAVDAYQRDYDVTIVRDCVASYDQEHHEVSLRYMDARIGRVISVRELLDELAAGSAMRG